MPYRLLDDGNYSGMNRELAPWQLKPGMVYDASNMIFDKPGIARRRGPTAFGTGTVNAFGTILGFCYSQDATPVEELYAINGKTGAAVRVDKGVGTTTALGTGGVTDGIQGRPVRHFGFVMFPVKGPTGANTRSIFSLAGITTNTSFTSSAAPTIAAGNPVITMGGADVTTNVKVGAIVLAINGTQQYFGRVTAINSGTTFTVSPTPTVAIAGAGMTTYPIQSGSGGSCGASFQNRMLVANTLDQVGGQITERRIYYSPLPTETGVSGATTVYGAHWLSAAFWPTLNYFDVPGADPIVAMEPVNDGELLILTSGTPWVLRGQLATQTTTFAPGVTFDLSPINLPADCLSDLSVQRTPRGIIWAGGEGIWVYGGGGRQPYSPGWRLPIDITEGAMHTYWRNLTKGSNFAVHGSSYARNHYMISGISGGTTFCLVYNVGNGSWTTFTNVDIFYGLPQPSNASQNWALRWWDQTGAAPSMVAGQMRLMHGLFQPYIAGSFVVDAESTAIPFSITTRSITDDTQMQRIVRRVSVRYQLSTPGLDNTMNVAVGTRIDPGDIVGSPSVSVGALGETRVVTITAATATAPIVITTGGMKLVDDDIVDIHGATGMTGLNGRWRVKNVAPFQHSLYESSGSGVYNASTATIKKITESEFECSALDIGQAVWVKVSGQPDDFELHGIRVGVMEIPWGMGH